MREDVGKARVRRHGEVGDDLVGVLNEFADAMRVDDPDGAVVSSAILLLAREQCRTRPGGSSCVSSKASNVISCGWNLQRTNLRYISALSRHLSTSLFAMSESLLDAECGLRQRFVVELRHAPSPNRALMWPDQQSLQNLWPQSAALVSAGADSQKQTPQTTDSSVDDDAAAAAPTPASASTFAESSKYRSIKASSRHLKWRRSAAAVVRGWSKSPAMRPIASSCSRASAAASITSSSESAPAAPPSSESSASTASPSPR